MARSIIAWPHGWTVCKQTCKLAAELKCQKWIAVSQWITSDHRVLCLHQLWLTTLQGQGEMDINMTLIFLHQSLCSETKTLFSGHDHNGPAVQRRGHRSLNPQRMSDRLRSTWLLNNRIQNVTKKFWFPPPSCQCPVSTPPTPGKKKKKKKTNYIKLTIDEMVLAF